MAREMNMLRTMHATKRKKHDEYSERSRVLHTVYRSTEHSEYASFSKLGKQNNCNRVVGLDYKKQFLS